MSIGDEANVDFQTARGRDWPSVRQFNIFTANRLGAMMDIVRRFESTTVRIVSITVVDSADCAIIRMVLSDAERATEILEQGKFPFTESDLVVVKVPEGPQPLAHICKALLSVEVSIDYVYPLLMGVGPEGHTALALHVDDHEQAVRILEELGFTLFTEGDLFH